MNKTEGSSDVPRRVRAPRVFVSLYVQNERVNAERECRVFTEKQSSAVM